MDNITLFFIGLMLIALLLAGGFYLILKQIGQRRNENQGEVARMKAAYDSQIELLRSQLKEQSEEIRRQSRLEFEAMANEALSRQKRSMEEENRRQMETILSPLRSRLEEFKSAVTDSYVKENAARQSLSDQIERLMKLNHSIGEEARNLTKALRGDSKVQGDWGETILEGLLEQAGLKRDINFAVQLSENEAGEALRDEEGNLRRPDVVVYLPEGRNIIIDSKVSLTAFADLTEAETEEERRLASRRLVESVRRHVGELSVKRYQKIVKNSADHVLMFMPNEGAYFAAISADSSLWDYAFRHNVVIVSPTHLFSVMQLVGQLWRGEKQNRNAVEIAKLGGLIYDKVAAFTRDFENIMKGIRSTETAYENCLRHLTSGPTSIMSRSRRLRELGAKTSGRISAGVERASDLNGDTPSSYHADTPVIPGLTDEPGSLEE